MGSKGAFECRNRSTKATHRGALSQADLGSLGVTLSIGKDVREARNSMPAAYDTTTNPRCAAEASCATARRRKHTLERMLHRKSDCRLPVARRRGAARETLLQVGSLVPRATAYRAEVDHSVGLGKLGGVSAEDVIRRKHHQ